MKKSNKILAVLLALVMMLTAVPMMTAGAEEAPAEPEAPAHVHAFEKTAEVKADCKTETNGSATYTCECGDAYTVETEKYDHKLIGTVKENDATTHKQRCDKCDAYVTEEHTFVDVEVTKPATCKEVGSKKVKCSACDYETTAEIEKVAHTYATYVVTETGHKAMCTVCGDVIEVAHDFAEVVSSTDAKCDAEGAEVKACVCGETKEFPIPAAHKLPEKPTVSEDVATHVYTCAIETCGHVFTAEELAALEKTTAHTFDVAVSDDANCAGEKGELTLTCSECDHVEEYEIIAKHVFGDPAKYDDDKHVQKCECGAETYADHVWGEGVVTKPATCAEAGVKTFTCACKATKTEEIAMTTEHTVAEWTVATPATCGAVGTEKGTCTVCNKEQTKEIPMLTEHTWGEWEVTKEPGIILKGEKTRKCSVCGKEETMEFEKEDVVGDINGDGKVQAIDARLVLQHVAGVKELSGSELARADVDGNGKVQAVDARRILRIVAGYKD